MCDRRRAKALADWLIDRVAAQGGGYGRSFITAAIRRPEAEDADLNTSERITLIEFVWEGRTGAQQVILVSREWLQ